MGFFTKVLAGVLAAGIVVKKLWPHVRCRLEWRKRSPEEKWNTAVHEAGHAVAAWDLIEVDGVDFVTIMPSAKNALGQTQHRFNEPPDLRKPEMRDALAVSALGGMAAEELILGAKKGGGAHDLIRAFALAIWEQQGGTYAHSLTAARLLFQQVLCDNPFFVFYLHLYIGPRIHEWLERAKKLLEPRREKILELARALLERRTLRRKAIAAILGPRFFAKT